MSAGQGRLDRLALKPCRGTLDVWPVFTEGDGNVGIIRRPVRAIALPDLSARKVAMLLCRLRIGDRF